MVNLELLDVKFEEEIPKYIQISNKIKSLIESKEIEDGEKLPPIRQLSKSIGVNNVTVVNAYKKLQSDGYAYQKVGSGTFAKRREVLTKFNREYIKILKSIEGEKYIDFTGERKSEINFPINDFKEVINSVLDRDGAQALLSQESLGYKNLREAINEEFWESKLDIETLMIVSGAQQGIDIAGKAILNINDNVIVEKPTYKGAISVFKWRRANIFEVGLEDDGVNLSDFEEILKKNRIRLFYTMSYFHNPTGITYSMEKKKRLLELAKKYDFYIVEDDYLSELIYDKELKHRPFKALDKNDRVIYIKSFSKVFLPGIRLGYLIAPKGFKEIIQNTKINTDTATSSLMQKSLELYIKRGYFKNHIALMQKEYEEKYSLMKANIKEKLSLYVDYLDPKGGLSFYLKINNNKIDSKSLFYKLKDKGVLITPGNIFYRDREEGNYTFRIGLLGVTLIEIEKGIEIIKEVFQDVYNH